MAYGDPIDRAYLDIDGVFVACDSIDVDPDDGTDFVEAMTPDNEPLGIKRGNRKFDIRADVTLTEGQENDIDFDDLWENKTVFSVVVRFENGKTHTWTDAVIAKPGLSAKTGDATTRSIEMKAWHRVIS